MSTPDFALVPSPAAATASRYHVPRAGAPIDVFLDGNEGAVPSLSLYDGLPAFGPDLLRRYPDAHGLEADFAARLGVDPARVLVTAGGDETIDRVCRALLAPGRELILPEPTFEMIARYARLSSGEIVPVPWPGGRWPVEAVLAAITPRTALICIVTPNNPTGAVATAEDIRRVAAAAPHALVLVDQAYVEFADADFTAFALSLPNAAVLRTVSKAWGLAGLRIGYCAGHATLIGWLRACGGPYPVSGVSVALARAALSNGSAAVDTFVNEIRHERAALTATLTRLGAVVEPSHANFVFARLGDHQKPLWLRDACAGFGIAIRAFPGKPLLEDAVRITCPGDPATFERLTHALETALAPEALIFDLDGVLADVSNSYREAIRGTCAAFGVTVTDDDIRAIKAAGNANNDWVVCQRILAGQGLGVAFEAVKAEFEGLYQGGLWKNETLCVTRAQLAAWAARYPLAIVTGRPKRDLDRFLDHFGLRAFFRTTVCMEEAPIKPNPAPVRLALERLGVTRAWMLGDTPDDQRACRGAAVLPLGVLAPGERDGSPLTAAGAARVLAQPADWEGLLP